MDENSGKNPSSLDETAQSRGNEKTGGNEEGRRNEKFGNYVRIGHKAVAGGVRDDSAGRAPESTGGAPERAGVWLVNIAGALCLTSALAAIVAIVGWPISESEMHWVRAGTRCTVGLFFIQEILRVAFGRDSFFRRFTKHWFETLLFLAAFVLIFAARPALPRLCEFFAGTPELTVRLGYAAVLNALILWAMLSRVMRFRKSFFSKISFNPGRLFIFSFVILICIGALLLKTPNAGVNEISWCDAFFLSTSSVCVTGLAPFDIATGLTFTGQCIVLVLIQLGGLGVMLITYFLAYFFSGGLSLRSRFDFQHLFSEDNIGQIGMALAVVVIFTFAAEAVGAIVIGFSMAGTPIADAQPVFFAVFHSISGFCNAGLSCVPGAMSNPELCRNMAMISSIFVMTIIGGLGFPVIKNFWLFFVDRVRSRTWRHSSGRVPVRLSTHTKIVLATSVGLMLFGFAAFFLLDWGNRGSESLLRSLFLAGASRTSGFDIDSTREIGTAAKLLLMALMFIGGSPFSTAGGIKTTTFAVALLSLRQIVLGRRDLEVFGRRLNSDFANYALAIVLLGAAAVFAVTVALCVLHPEIDFLSLSFEAVSAVGTVGLSCDVTPHLGVPAKYLIAVTMLAGRIGIVLIITSFLPKKSRAAKARFPETTIVLA